MSALGEYRRAMMARVPCEGSGVQTRPSTFTSTGLCPACEEMVPTSLSGIAFAHEAPRDER